MTRAEAALPAVRRQALRYRRPWVPVAARDEMEGELALEAVLVERAYSGATDEDYARILTVAMRRHAAGVYGRARAEAASRVDVDLSAFVDPEPALRRMRAEAAAEVERVLDGLERAVALELLGPAPRAARRDGGSGRRPYGTVADAAARLGVPPRAAYAAFARALRKLREAAA